MTGVLPILRAVTAWDGPAEAKHFLLTLCALADHWTCVGIYGQKRIAEAMGKSERTVRTLFDQLEKTPGCPVRVRRRARMKAEGKGRTSDEWTLSIAEPTGNGLPLGHDQQATDDRLDLQPTGNPLPLIPEPLRGDQPATQNAPTGNLEHDQPAMGCRVSVSVDQNLGSESDLPRVGTPQSESSEQAQGTSTRHKPKATTGGRTKAPEMLEPTAATLAVARETGRDWRKDWLECRDWAWSNNKFKADWQATLRGWQRRNAMKAQAFAPRKAATPSGQRGMAEHVTEGDTSWLNDEPKKPKPQLELIRGAAR